MTLEEKYKVLQEELCAMKSVAVAFPVVWIPLFISSSRRYTWQGSCDGGHSIFLFFPGKRTKGSTGIL